MTKPCPVCGAAASGKFCSQCGSPLDLGRTCSDCGSLIPPDGRFCNMCGKVAAEGTGAPKASMTPTVANRAAAATAPPTAGSEPAPSPAPTGKLPWVIGGIAAALVLAVIIIPRLGSEPQPTPPTQTTDAAVTGTPPDLTTMTPEDAALRLFSRVMTAASEGDSAQARSFAPMAISAYGMMPEVTLDHRYDMAMIHFVTGDAAAAAAQADTILAEAPTHLFGLAAAAEAAARLGEADRAREYYQRYLDNYDSEVADNAVAYEMHPNLPAAIRMAAIAYLDASDQ